MNYLANKIITAYTRTVEVYERVKRLIQDGMIFPSGLELAVAGAPNRFVSERKSALETYSLQSNVDRWYPLGDKIMVVGNGGKKTVPLNPASVQHDTNGYVSKKLRDNGFRATSAMIKKIARQVEKLRK